MVLPTSIPTTARDAFNQVLSTAFSVKSNLAGVSNLISGGGPVLVDNLIGLYTNLNSSRAAGYTIQTVPGLADYAKTAMNDPNYDIVASFQASIVACKAVTDWLLANMPSDGNGGFVGWRKQADGTIQRVTVDLASLAPLQALIGTAIATFS